MGNIELLRQSIDEIDKALVELLEKRMTVVEEVAAYKIHTGAPLKDEAREKALIDKNIDHLKNPEYSRFIKAFFKDMMEYSRSYQRELIYTEKSEVIKDFRDALVGYQGIEGSFSSLALKGYFNEVKQKKAYGKFEHVFEALTKHEIDYGILPIENSSTGAINEVYDLMKHYDVQIVGDYYLPIEHHLIGLEDAQIEDIIQVFSHEQGFKQSSEFLSDKTWQLNTYFNTAKSVLHVKELNQKENAAIGSRYAAETYGLRILKEHIHNEAFNATRFVVIALKRSVSQDANKISMILRLSHEPKALYNVLKVIAEKNINMHKLESRPIVDKPWSYCFYMDIEGQLSDSSIQDALQQISDVSQDLIILGNYYSRNGV